MRTLNARRYAASWLAGNGFERLQHDGDAHIYLSPADLTIEDAFRASVALGCVGGLILDNADA